MPKLIDSYVLTHEIGKGQFGKVYRGYDRTTNNDVAVKVMQRKKIVGKLVEQLERQIKVLKTCDNSNIIRLYDIKKTSNNIYVILEYCNEGDLEGYVKKKKCLTEEEALDFLTQILNGFKTLYSNKIMHRDFKLANVLKHNGEVKIGDFGFSKLLGDDEWTNTYLGSPLNMAPEILKSKEYNQKADIYSIGVSFYEMLFGKPPYNAANRQLLVQVIEKGDPKFPKEVNKVSQLTKKLIRSMLEPNLNNRIDWQELFQHPALRQRQTEVEKLLEMSIVGAGGLMSNMSKFYLKNNLVILQVADILKKQEVNNYAFDIFKANKAGGNFKGNYIKNKETRKEQVNKKVRTHIKSVDDDNFQEQEYVEDKLERIMKENTNFLFNQRNKYTFILTIIDELDQINSIKGAEQLRYVIAQQLHSKIQEFFNCIKTQKNQFKLPEWETFLQCSAFKLLRRFFEKEYEIFDFQIQNIIGKNQKVVNAKVAELVKIVCNGCIQILNKKKEDPNDENNRIHWIRLDHILDYIDLEEIMATYQFDFKMYYNENGRIELPELIKKVKRKVEELKV